MKVTLSETPRSRDDDPYRCMDCNGICDSYHVKEDVWREAVPNEEEAAIRMSNKKRIDDWEKKRRSLGPALDAYELPHGRHKLTQRVMLCFNCLERRLNRPLVLENFSDAQVNRPVFLGAYIDPFAKRR